MILVDAQGVSSSRPGRPLFTDVSLTVRSGDRIGVVGINGTGKSTLLEVLAGRLTPDTGVVRVGRGVRIGMLDQDPQLPTGTVRDAVGGGWQGAALLDRFGMGDRLDASVDELSGGQVKRVALARVLVGEHDLLVLDEPTNHLDLDAVATLEEHLAGFSGGVLLVTHDRHVLDRVTTRVLEIDRGRTYVHVPAGPHAGSGYAAYLAGRIEREERAATAEGVRRNLAKRELAWLRRGAPARSTKPKARVAAATALVTARADAPARSGELSLQLGTNRLGSQGIEIHGVSFHHPGGPLVLDGIDHVLEPGDRLGIVGPNGAGKSTLLDLVAGRLEPTAGRVVRGATVRIGYHDQVGRDLPLHLRVRDMVAGDRAEPTVADIALMRRFWFDGDAQWAPVGTLSGGERRRLQLLLTLVAQPNVLLLDEPTNDLDLDTLRALEDLLDDWPGIAVVASHDRTFLDRTVTEVLAVDGRGGAARVRGGVAGWLAQRATERTPAPSRAVATPSAPASAAATTRATPETPRRPVRSPSTLRRLVAQAERDLAAAVERRDGLAGRLGTLTDHAALTATADELATAQARVDELEHLWLELTDELDRL